MKKLFGLSVIISVGMLFFACEKLKTKKAKYPNGNLKSRWEVTVSKEGEFKNGVSEEFYESGKLRKTGTNKKGKLINIKEYNEQGKLIK